uniref:Small ribosomal subunit protein uS19c n=1 Tax=Phacus orbicularis TaxID=158829 RepID=A0A182B0Y8_9EUGL|nr:ribosomal protein S19 [Phacus orbicularis]
MSRSLKKGPFLSFALFDKIKKMSSSFYKKVILTWSRSSTVLPMMIGYTLALYNGREHIPVFISEQMVGHKLGEFVQTRNFKGHIKTDKKIKR